MNVLNQLKFGLGGANDQNFRRTFQRLCDTVVVVLIFWGTTVSERSYARVKFVGWLVRLNQRLFNVIRADVHYMGLHVVQPDKCMVVRHMELLASDKSSDTIHRNAPRFISTVDGSR